MITRDDRRIYQLLTQKSLSTRKISNRFGKRTSCVMNLETMNSNSSSKCMKQLKKFSLMKHHKEKEHKRAKKCHDIGQEMERNDIFRLKKISRFFGRL